MLGFGNPLLGAQVPFSPEKLAQTLAWWRADSATKITTTTSGSHTYIATWRDEITGINPALVGGQLEVLSTGMNGKPGVQAGGNATLSLASVPSAIPMGTNELVVIAAVKQGSTPYSTGSSDEQYSMFCLGQVSAGRLHYKGPDNVEHLRQQQSGYEPPIGTATPGAYDILLMDFSSSTNTSRKNGSAASSGGTAVSASTSGFVLFGESSTHNQYMGVIGDMIFCAGLTSGQRDRYEGYLAWKYGIQSKLPVGHLCRNSPPTI